MHWRAALDVVGTDPLNPQNATRGECVTTRDSAAATFHVVDQDGLRKREDFDAAEHACRVVKGELASTLHKLRTNPASMRTPARFGYYHQVLVRARKKCVSTPPVLSTRWRLVCLSFCPVVSLSSLSAGTASPTCSVSCC